MQHTKSPLVAASLAWALLAAVAFATTACEKLGIRRYEPKANPAPRSVPVQRRVPQGFRRLGGPGAPPPLAVSYREETEAPAPVVQASPQRGSSSSGYSTINGHPQGLSRDVLNSAIHGTMSSLAGCFSPSTQSPMVAVSFEADPAGRASLVRVNGAPPDAERCIRNVIQGMRLPRFEGNGVRIDLPLAFHQVARSQPSAAQPAAAAPSGPPLFIQP